MTEQQFKVSGVEALTAFRDAMKDTIEAFPDGTWTNEEVLGAIEDCLSALVFTEAQARLLEEAESDEQ